MKKLMRRIGGAFDAAQLMIFMAMMGYGTASRANTLGDWATYLTRNTVQPIVTGLIYAFYAGGVVSIGIGINKLIQKSKPGGAGGQVGATEIGAYILGGAMLCGITYLADTSFESLSGVSNVSSSSGNIRAF